MSKKGRERDSNPRQFFVQNYTGFQDRGYQPLSHLSERQFLFYSSEQNMTIGQIPTICRKTSGGNLPSIRIYEPARPFVKSKKFHFLRPHVQIKCKIGSNKLYRINVFMLKENPSMIYFIKTFLLIEGSNGIIQFICWQIGGLKV